MRAHGATALRRTHHWVRTITTILLAVLLTAGLSMMSATPPSASSRPNPTGPAELTIADPGGLITTASRPHVQQAKRKKRKKLKLPKRARVALKRLKVKKLTRGKGYNRLANFGPAWKDVDGNGCDTRNDILARDLKRVRYGDAKRCIVTHGVLRDPYTGIRIQFRRGPGTSNAVHIDHVVALHNAWRSGAHRLTQAQREQFANDPLNLLAVDGPANMRKSDKDAAQWLPRQKFQCKFVARQISVKFHYKLWVRKPEKRAMRRVLKTCPKRKTFKSPFPAVKKLGKKANKHGKAQAKVKYNVWPGSYCSPPGAIGYTAKGTKMRCTSTATDASYRWRAA